MALLIKCFRNLQIAAEYSENIWRITNSALAEEEMLLDARNPSIRNRFLKTRTSSGTVFHFIKNFKY